MKSFASSKSNFGAIVHEVATDGGASKTKSVVDEKSLGSTCFDELKKQTLEHYAIPLDAMKGVNLCCMSAAGSTQLESSGRVKVDSARDTLHVRGRFRAIGSKPSVMYFGIREFTNVGGFDECVSSEQALRGGNACRVLSYSESDMSLVLAEAPAGWMDSETAPLHQIRLGFYLDGEIDHPKLPPILFAPNSGPAYRSISGNVMKLASPLPANIVRGLVPNVTRIMNHRAGPTWSYGGMNGEQLDPKSGWVNREFTVRPPNKSMFTNNTDSHPCLQYRPFTNSITLLVLANWGQTKDDTEVLVADLNISLSSTP